MLRPPARRAIALLLPLSLLVACTSGGGHRRASAPTTTTTLPNSTAQVDPFIGTAPAAVANPVPGGAGGDTFPGATTPFGAVQFSPDTPGAENDTGYSYDSTTIEAFSMVHYSGAGCPNNELVRLLPTLAGNEAPVGFTHADERAEPGYYTVTLANGIRVELTATTRTGTARITFPAGSRPGLVLDADHRESTFGADFPSSVAAHGDRTLWGTVGSGAFCGTPSGSYDVHFAAELDQPFTVVSHDANGVERIGFAPSQKGGPTTVEVRVGLSWVSQRNAAANLRAEAHGKTFASLRRKARGTWNDVLGRIRIDGGTAGQRRTFMTALYHSLLHPNVDSDVNGEYLGFDHKVHTLPSAQLHYANFSGWDIYRSQVQLLAVVVPERADDIARSMLDMAEECGGGFPKWTSWTTETSVMIGDPGAVMMANLDAFGVKGVDTKDVLEVMHRSAFDPKTQCGFLRLRPGLTPYIDRGYTPSIPYAESQSPLAVVYMWQHDLGDVSTTLEYAVADAGIAAYAARHGDAAMAKTLRARAANWQNVFDPSTGYVRPRLQDGSFYSPFDPSSQYGFTEGNAAQYTWLVPQAYGALVDRLGGPKKVEARLDSFFTELNAGLTKPYFYIGNEPLFTAPWAYVWADAPARTQGVVRRILEQEFADTPGGLPGNDDLGAMSSWYVWAAMGMFPVVPGQDVLTLNTPHFSSVTIAVPGHETIRIDAPGAPGNTYVASARLGGKRLDRAWLRWADLAKGATLDFDTSATATTWAAGSGHEPPSLAAGGS